MHDIMISVVVRLSYNSEFPEVNFYEPIIIGVYDAHTKPSLTPQKKPTILNNFQIPLLPFSSDIEIRFHARVTL